MRRDVYQSRDLECNETLRELSIVGKWTIFELIEISDSEAQAEFGPSLAKVVNLVVIVSFNLKNKPLNVLGHLDMLVQSLEVQN